MSAICGLMRDSFDDYLGDRLPAPQRQILREHLAACEPCRAAATSRDACLAFARPFAQEDVAPDETAAILASVRTGVAHIETERRVAGANRSRRRSAVAAAAAATGIAALLALTVPGGSARRGAAAPAATPAAVAAADAPTPVSGVEPAGLPSEVAAPSSNATVYDLNPGAGREEPRVVWIVDRGLDI